jgi:hypothetical protein
MKKQIAVALAGALFSSIAVAQAPPIEAVQVTGAAPHFALPALQHNMWYDEFDQVRGGYALSNGGYMDIGMWGNRMYASISGVGRTQLVAESPYVFVARDGRTRITLTDPAMRSDDQADAVIQLLSAQPAVAGAPVEVTTLY